MDTLQKIIEENTEDLIQGYNEGLISITDMEELLKEAEIDEEYEIAISIRNVLKTIKNGKF